MGARKASRGTKQRKMTVEFKGPTPSIAVTASSAAADGAGRVAVGEPMVQLPLTFLAPPVPPVGGYRHRRSAVVIEKLRTDEEETKTKTKMMKVEIRMIFLVNNI